MAQESHKIFLDSSFFISFIDRANLDHLKTVALFEFLARNHYQPYTSSLVIFQSFNRLERELGQAVSLDFFQAMLESNIEVIYPSKAEMVAAFRLIKSNTQRQTVLTEIVSSIIMEKNGIGTVLTYDFWHNLLGTSLSPLLQQH